MQPYEKQQQSFQSPPPFSVTLNNGGVGGHHTGGSYTPVFISPMPPAVAGQAHHVTAPMHHQVCINKITYILRLIIKIPNTETTPYEIIIIISTEINLYLFIIIIFRWI